jgi:site-specific DNA-methyltransferase (adenine-specific)
MEHGTAGINVDGCRVGTRAEPPGRWPPHVLLDDDAAAMLDDSAKFFPRFKYQAKPSTKEKSAGLEHLPTLSGYDATGRRNGEAGLRSPRAGAGRTGSARNPHPTVKPIELMRWLCRLITPPGGTVLDPFTGSGTTGCAAVLEGFGFVGVEQSAEYIEVARSRIAHWERVANDGLGS